MTKPTMPNTQQFSKAQIIQTLKAGPRRWDGQGTDLDPNLKPGQNPIVEKLRAALVNDDFETVFRMLPAPEWPRISMGKFRFDWGPDGKPIYKAWTRESMNKFFGGPWLIIDQTWDGTCPDDFINKYSHDYFHDSEKHNRAYKSDNPAKVFHMYPASLKCKKKQGSRWVQVRKPVVAAVAVVAAVYLGPVVLNAIKGAMAGGGAAGAGAAGAAGAAGSTAATSAAAASAASAAAAGAAGAGAVATGATLASQVTLGAKILAGAQTLTSYVNKGRTIKAIAEGKAPPPPINISGSNFTDWAMTVAKDEIAKEAKERAAALGQEYIAKKWTAAEEAKLRAEIEAMQRELQQVIPKEVQQAPPEPSPELAPQIKQIQAIEEKRHDDMQKYLLPAALVIGALLLGG